MRDVAKLRLVAWLVFVGGAAVVLLRDVGWSSDPSATVMAVVRAAAGVLAAYLFVATVLALARVSVPRPAFVRRFVATAVGGTLLVVPMAAGATEPRAAPTTIEAPVLRRLDPQPPAADAATAPVAEAVAPPESPTVVVRPGDHLWAIAERAVGARLGREPSDEEIAGYWRQVVAANRDRLASRDPDVIFAGEVITLP